MILVDTHIVIWLAFNPEQLSKKAAAAIADARQSDDGLAVSGITLYELACAVSKKRLRLAIPVESFLEEVASHFVIKPITAQIAAAASKMPANYPKDPMDRIIGATAIVEELSLITADGAIQKSKVVNVIW